MFSFLVLAEVLFFPLGVMLLSVVETVARYLVRDSSGHPSHVQPLTAYSGCPWFLLHQRRSRPMRRPLYITAFRNFGELLQMFRSPQRLKDIPCRQFCVWPHTKPFPLEQWPHGYHAPHTCVDTNVAESVFVQSPYANSDLWKRKVKLGDNIFS
jgi:hypothetical protein